MSKTDMTELLQLIRDRVAAGSAGGRFASEQWKTAATFLWPYLEKGDGDSLLDFVGLLIEALTDDQ